MPEDNSSSDQIKQLAERLDYLEMISRETASRLYAIEKRLGLNYLPPEVRAASEAKEAEARAERERASRESIRPPDTHPQRPIADAFRPVTQQPGSIDSSQSATPPLQASADAARPPQTAPIPAPPTQRVLGAGAPQGPLSSQAAHAEARPRPRSRGDLESRIGGNWFNRIGIIAIFIGAAFFLKYAYDSEWIGPWGQVLIVAAVGVAFLIGGERLRPRYHSYAHGLSGGGILILYLAIYAAHAIFDPSLIPVFPAFIGMAMVTLTAVILAGRYDALPIAILGLIGGFLTPVLLSTGQNNEAGLFGYIALLDLGVLALAYSKKWRSLNYLSFGATALMFAAWWISWDPFEKLALTIFFLTLFFAIFALLAVLYNIINRRQTEWGDLAMVFANALLYFGASYYLLKADYHAALGLFAVLVSAFYLGLGYFTYRRDGEDRLLLYTFLGLSLLFAVLAVPIQLDQHWTTMGWAIEGAVITWVGLKAADRTSRMAGLVVFVIAITHWFLIDVPGSAYGAGGDFTPVFNRRALSCAVLVAALAAAAGFYKRYPARVEQEERSMYTGLYLLGANALAVTLLSLDANDYFEQAKHQAGLRPDGPQSGEWDQLNNAHWLTLSVLWSVYGAMALIVGVTRKLKPLRIGALVLLAATALKLFAMDLRYYRAPWHTTLFNETFAAFAILIAALAAGAWFYSRGDNIEGGERWMALSMLIGLANVLAVVALSAEVVGHFDRVKAFAHSSPVAELDRIENTKHLVLTALWVAYGAAAFAVGVKRRLRPLRLAALALITLAAVKVIVVDLSYYDAAWHTLIFNQTFASFALLIAALALGVRLYSRAESVDEDERSIITPMMMAAANLLAIIALSAEAFGYFSVKMGREGLSPDELSSLRLAQQLSLSVIWMVYGGAMLTIGIWRRNRLLRMMALLLLGLTILKVFLLDLTSLETIYRIISFIVLGAILLVVSYLYQRYRQRTTEQADDMEADAPVPTD